MAKSRLLRMDNVGIVVESVDDAISFFAELGLELEGRAMIEGEWAGRVTGLGVQKVEIAMMVTPDGHSRLELSQFLDPPVISDHRTSPVNALGYLRAMFTVSDLDETLARLNMLGASLVGEVVRYEDSYRLCYVRGPEGILIGLAEEIEAQPMTMVDLHHVQLAMPPGGETLAVEFYEGLLGLPRVSKPAHLEARGGCWFESDRVRIHLGVEGDFRPARKAHPALLVESLDALRSRLADAGVSIVEDQPLPAFERFYVSDPFGNRIEFLAAK